MALPLLIAALQDALERAQAAATGPGAAERVRESARQHVQQVFDERGWLAADGSVVCPANKAWLITARCGLA